MLSGQHNGGVQRRDNLYDAYKKGQKMPAVNIGTIGGGPGRKVVAPQGFTSVKKNYSS